MVTIPNFEKYRQGDFIQYMNNVRQILTENRAAQFNIEQQHYDLFSVVEQLNKVWQPGLGSELTPEIQDLDDKRDMALNGLKMTVDAWATSHYDASWRNAAYIVSGNIARHGDRIYLMRYQQQTATVNAIIKDLQDALAVHVNTLGLMPWVTQLGALNEAFNQKFVERTKAVAWTEPGIVVELISTATTAFRKLKTIFEARLAVAEADQTGDVSDFKQVEGEWSTLGKQYNDAVNRSTGTNQDGEIQPPTENNSAG